jgi:Na+/melibiose symporter-like transporter
MTRAAASPSTGPLRLLLYALPAFALAMPTIPVYVFLPTFYAEDLGLGLAVTGAVLLAARMLDVVTDPVIGVVSDRYRFRWGRRKPWMIAGGAIAAISLVQLFQPPAGAGWGYLLGWVIALYFGWTLLAVPYTAWGAEMSDDYHVRARITGARESAMILGILAAGAIPAIAPTLGWSHASALAAVAWLAVITGAPALALLAWRVPDRSGTASSAGKHSFGTWREHASVLRNGAFLRLLSGWFVNGLANGLPAVLFPLYLQYALQADEAERGLLILTYFLAGVAAIPLWVRLSRRHGKHRVWCGAMVLACAAFLWVPWLEPGAIGAFFVICILTGMAFGADLALPPAMQADVIDLDTLRTRTQRAGWYFALWSMATKLALAAAVGFAFPTLAAFGFEAGGKNGPAAIAALTTIYALVPVALKLVAVAVIWRHPITAERQDLIRRRLASRASRS